MILHVFVQGKNTFIHTNTHQCVKLCDQSLLYGEFMTYKLKSWLDKLYLFELLSTNKYSKRIYIKQRHIIIEISVSWIPPGSDPAICVPTSPAEEAWTYPNPEDQEASHSAWQPADSNLHKHTKTQAHRVRETQHHLHSQHHCRITSEREPGETKRFTNIRETSATLPIHEGKWATSNRESHISEIYGRAFGK